MKTTDKIISGAGATILAAIPIVGGIVAIGAIGYGIHKYYKSKNKDDEY